MRAALLPLAVACGADLAPESLGEFLRATFAETHSAERQILRELRGGPGRKTRDTLARVDSSAVHAVAPTSVFAAISGGPGPQASGADPTYVGVAPSSHSGATFVGGVRSAPESSEGAAALERGRTEPALPHLETGEFVLRPIGRANTAGELRHAFEAPKPRSLLDLPAPAPTRAAPCSETLQNNTDPLLRAAGPATVPGMPPLVLAPAPVLPGPKPLPQVTEPVALGSAATEPPSRTSEPPVSRVRPVPGAAPPRSRSGTAVPVARARGVGAEDLATARGRVGPMLLGIGLGVAIVGLAAAALVLLMHH
jgi:hypothetical protein